MNLHLDRQFVVAAIDKLLTDFPELQDDETLRADMLEAETDAHRLIERALSQHNEASMLAVAMKLREDEMAARRARFERKSDAMRSLIRSVMQAARLDKITLPEATISTTKPKSSVNITAEDELPQGYFKTIRQADKAAIKTALERGEEIPGAELARGEAGIMIRTK